MTPVIICCFEDDDVAAAVRCMRDQQIRYLPVLNRHKDLVGVVSVYALALHTSAAVDWLTAHAVTHAAMERTGVLRNLTALLAPW